MLYFQRKFFDAIRRGEKTQTIRLWRHQRVKPGTAAYVPGLGRVWIISVDAIALESLTSTDARRDGFETLADLQAEISRLYPQGLTEGRRAWRISFQFPAPVPNVD